MSVVYSFATTGSNPCNCPWTARFGDPEWLRTDWAYRKQPRNSYAKHCLVHSCAWIRQNEFHLYAAEALEGSQS